MANMGTNLSQVFIANDDTLAGTGAFNSLATTAGSQEVGVWSVDDGDYIQTALYSTAVDVTDEVAGSDTEEVTDNITTVANPLWLKKRIQIAQGASGQPIATPLIDTRNIRSVRFDPYAATVAHKRSIKPNGTFASMDVTVKFIIRTLPVDQLSYHDGDGTDYTILSGTDPLPLGIFNATNHKSISVEVQSGDYTNGETFIDKLETAIDGHGLLGKLIKTTQNSTTHLDVESKHVGLIFDVVVIDGDGNNLIVSSAASNKVELDSGRAANYTIGVGNPWQVLGEEIRCRSRQGNFNRMYLPINQTTYTQSGHVYHKLTISYEHNWPTGSGIAPAGTLNQAVLYIGADGTADTTSDTNIDTVFSIADLTAAQEFVW